jgi:hypothetical protein
MKSRALVVAAAAALLSLSALPALAQSAAGSAFTYQGQLKTSGAPATGVFDLQFKLFSAATDGMQIGGTVFAPNVNVSGGLFSTSIDFGVAAFEDGEKRWLEISVKADANANYTTLNPRQELTPAPYAVCADRVGLPLLQFGDTPSAFGTSGLFHIYQSGTGNAIVGQTNNSGNGMLGLASGVTGSAGKFWNLLASNDEPALVAAHSGTGWGISASSNGGRAGSFEITNPSNPNIALYGYTAGNGHGVQGYSVGSGKGVGGYNNGTGNAGYFRIGNDQSAADAVYVEHLGSGKGLSVRSTEGPALYARSTSGGPALQTDGGGIKVTGAGINTNTWVFTHQTSASNTAGTRTYLNNPNCNNKPNVIILVTNAFNGGGVFPRPVAVGYESSNGRWYLHDMDNDEMYPGGYRFNIMIITP